MTQSLYYCQFIVALDAKQSLTPCKVSSHVEISNNSNSRNRVCPLEICPRFVRTWTLHNRTMAIPVKYFGSFQSVTLSCSTPKSLQLAINWKVFAPNICCFHVSSSARCRLSLGMTSCSIPRPDFLQVVHWHFSSICEGFCVLCENVNSAASWRPRPEVTSPFDSPTPIS
jgi:hypothetical protein